MIQHKHTLVVDQSLCCLLGYKPDILTSYFAYHYPNLPCRDRALAVRGERTARETPPALLRTIAISLAFGALREDGAE